MWGVAAGNCEQWLLLGRAGNGGPQASVQRLGLELRSFRSKAAGVWVSDAGVRDLAGLGAPLCGMVAEGDVGRAVWGQG